ncbi:MAG: BrnT family toxin [Acidobacteriota bacterium]
MRVEWDQKKNVSNQIKHGIDFETAKLVFDDPYCVNFVERVTDGEERWHAIGLIEDVIVVVVVHTYEEKNSEEVIRIISARSATRRERNLYAEAIG